MKTEFTVAADAIAEGVTEDGKKVKLQKVTITPTFWNPTSTPPMLYFQSISEAGDLIQRGSVNASGTNGKLNITDRTKSVKPKFEAELVEDPDEEEDDDEYEDE